MLKSLSRKTLKNIKKLSSDQKKSVLRIKGPNTVLCESRGKNCHSAKSWMTIGLENQVVVEDEWIQ